MGRSPRGPVSEIAAAMSGRSTRGRSALYRWLAGHFDQIQPDRAARPDWVAVTERLTGLGIVNGDGSPLRPENVRKTWARVVRDYGSAAPQQRKAAPARRKAVASARPVVTAAAAPQAPPVPAGDDPMAEIRAQWEERERKMPAPLDRDGITNKGKK